MKGVLLQRAMKLNRNHKQRKWWQRLVRTMAMVVVFCTTYALILPAITMEHQPICGMEEHAHGQDCYGQQMVSVWECGLEEADVVVHSHEGMCYGAEGELLCTLPEISAHIHDDGCYGLGAEPSCDYAHEHGEDCAVTERVLVCGKEAASEHVHTEDCTTKQVLVCVLPEGEGHTHSADCGSSQSILICLLPEGESHTHGEGCYQTLQLPCAIPEFEGHTHGALCYQQQSVPCPVEQEGHAHTDACYEERVTNCDAPTTQEHVHADSCFEKTLTCQKEEVRLHAHGAACRDASGMLVCGQPQVVVHTHMDSCLPQKEQLSCQLQEHTHEAQCYGAEENAEAEYLCGSGAHSHVQSCFDDELNLICTIPEHQHKETCMVENYDPTADMETPQDWEESLKDVALNGIWAEDLLAVAQSQLGYRESSRNVRLEDDRLYGYTRYGAKFDDPYAKWDAMFILFCMEYAEITPEYIPYETDTAKWIPALQEAGRYGAAENYIPTVGDLVFMDKNGDDQADHVGIFAELMENGDRKILVGDTEEGSVAFEILEDKVLGYGILPENPLSQEQWRAANALAAQIAALPDAEAVRTSFETLNEQGDKTGFEALRQELASRIEEIETVYKTFNDLQKQRAGSLEKLEALKTLCGGLNWRQHPALTDDSAVVSGLTVGEAQILPGTQPLEDKQPENTLRNGDTARYTVTVETESYYTDIQYGEARVKLELMLPFAPEEAVFDLAAMPWLENAVESTEVRTISGQNTTCQVVTGYKHMTAQQGNTPVVPGSFTETVDVKLKALTNGDELTVTVSAAMEHSTWDGECPVHQVEEKMTVITEAVSVYAPLSPEEQEAVYQGYLAELYTLSPNGEKLSREILDPLYERIAESFRTGALSEEQYSDLNERILTLSGVDLQSIAEPAVGNGWVWMDFGDPNFVPETTVHASSARRAHTPMMTAMPADLSEELGLDSNSQIPADGWGGENSQDDVIWVSKTIEGTEQENVFDITLQIITNETVNEVYKEPDMAVVIVTDISQTMVSIFSGETTVTRYNAAMDAAEHFMEDFAEKTDGVSKLGYVAFNTHGHEIFPMQECSTAAQAKALAQTMRTETKYIMDHPTDGKAYASSHDRFTNIEAGLKMARDMLKGVKNQHKYIVFLSDGFPTTYVKSGYDGYDPYTTGGSNGTNGVFFDRVMGHHCDYGTSYSDTAAIKAREMAVSMKKEGINIFSIGVDVEGQTIYEYHWDSALRLKTASTVERRQYAEYYNSTGYEIGTLHSEITASVPEKQEESSSVYPKKYLTERQRTDMSNDFKNWLKGSEKTGIGSGYYFESTDQKGLEAAYAQIFQKILELNAESAKLDWVATDPMPEMGVHELETMEFVAFWDMYQKQPELAESLTGESMDNALFYNTATYDKEESTIIWDLKKSGYQSVAFDENKNYMCALRYRVRLQNENTGFIEEQSYDTNDTTYMYYRIIEVVNNETQISSQKYIEFPIPKVFGYLSELNFLKTDPIGDPIPGVKFQLTHDTENCGTCRGDGEGYVDLPVYEAVSGDDGMVKFARIPSGHHYLLTEVETPAQFIPTTNVYHVEIAYNNLSVTVTDADGNALEWNETIENDTYYTLPHTGSMGTSSHYAFGGILILAAAFMYVRKFGRKHRRGGGTSR